MIPVAILGMESTYLWNAYNLLPVFVHTEAISNGSEWEPESSQAANTTKWSSLSTVTYAHGSIGPTTHSPSAIASS